MYTKLFRTVDSNFKFMKPDQEVKSFLLGGFGGRGFLFVFSSPSFDDRNGGEETLQRMSKHLEPFFLSSFLRRFFLFYVGFWVVWRRRNLHFVRFPKRRRQSERKELPFLTPPPLRRRRKGFFSFWQPLELLEQSHVIAPSFFCPFFPFRGKKLSRGSAFTTCSDFNEGFHETSLYFANWREPFFQQSLSNPLPPMQAAVNNIFPTSCSSFTHCGVKTVPLWRLWCDLCDRLLLPKRAVRHRRHQSPALPGESLSVLHLVVGTFFCGLLRTPQKVAGVMTGVFAIYLGGGIRKEMLAN